MQSSGKTPRKQGQILTDEFQNPWVNVHLTGMFSWISPNTELHFDLRVFRAILHLTSSWPQLCSSWNLGEGRLGNHFHTVRKKTKQCEGLGYQVDLTAGHRSTNQWLFCTGWLSLFLTPLARQPLNYLLFLDFLFSFILLQPSDSCFSTLQLKTNRADILWWDRYRSFTCRLNFIITLWTLFVKIFHKPRI